jgi:prepilin-type N-terminal cleavage/methylation domain-containing protein
MLEVMGENSSVMLTYCRSRRARGFTLLEIMVVIAIMGLVVAIGYPNMRRGLMRARMMSQVGVLKQAVGMARATSLKRGRGVAVRLLESSAEQEGGVVLAWVDMNGNGIHDGPAEDVVGRWNVKSRIILKPDPSRSLFKLGPANRGVLFLPNGTARSTETGSAGVGRGAVVLSDRVNEVRLSITGGTGTVVAEMWDPDNATWSKDLRYWRY